MKVFVSLLVSLIASAGFAADLGHFAQASSAFQSGHAPTGQTLVNALWMATSQSTSTASGRFPDGKIVDDQGAHREIAKFVVTGRRVAATFTYTDADIGTLIGETRQSGRLQSAGLELIGAGDATSCQTRNVCRELSDGTLLCAQSNDDSRAVCKKSYKKGDVVAYVGYRPVHH